MSAIALSAYEMDDAMVKWIRGFVHLLLREPQNKADFHLLIILLHSEKTAIAEQNTSGCLIEWLIYCLITHRVTDFGIG